MMENDPSTSPRPSSMATQQPTGPIMPISTSENPSRCRSCVNYCKKSLFWLGSVVVAAVAVGYVGIQWWFLRQTFLTSDIVYDLHPEGIAMFRKYDRDDDGFLSMLEFAPIAFKLSSVNESQDYEQPIELDDNLVTVRSYFEPIDMSSLSKELREYHENLECLRFLKKWKNQHALWRNFAVKNFHAFLPKDRNFLNIGRVYRIIDFPITKPADGDGAGVLLSSNRFDPPWYPDHEVTFQRLLSMFHPKVFLHMRFGPQGGFATVRAYNQDYVDIVFRIHAEYQLNEPPYHPFWFTPAQFTGNLIISRDGEHVRFFHLYVPTDRHLNVDMEWLNSLEPQDMQVDIGFIPQMELKTTAPSQKASIESSDVRKLPVPDYVDHEESIKSMSWMNDITFSEAQKALELELYPYTQVDYVNFTKVFQLAEAENKLVHLIMLWGALDDQSC